MYPRLGTPRLSDIGISKWLKQRPVFATDLPRVNASHPPVECWPLASASRCPRSYRSYCSPICTNGSPGPSTGARKADPPPRCIAARRRRGLDPKRRRSQEFLRRKVAGQWTRTDILHRSGL